MYKEHHLGSARHLSCLGPIPFPGSPCFLHAPRTSAVTVGVAASAGSQFGEPSFTFGGQKSLMAVIILIYWYGRRYFHLTKIISILRLVSQLVSNLVIREIPHHIHSFTHTQRVGAIQGHGSLGISLESCLFMQDSRLIPKDPWPWVLD